MCNLFDFFKIKQKNIILKYVFNFQNLVMENKNFMN